MSYTGSYINLDRTPDRREEIESELARFNLTARYRRFAAADGNTIILKSPLNPNEIGCFVSHAAVLKANRGDKHVHIVEDDTLFAPNTESIILRLIESGEMDKIDVLYTDVSLPLSNEAYREFKSLYDRIVVRDAAGNLQSAAFQILDLNRLMFATNSSYIVNKRAIDKILKLYDDEMGQGPRVPVDTFLRQLADRGRIKSGCVFPFITSARIERTMTSTVRAVPDVTMKFTAANIARYSFFIGCDWRECEETLKRLIPLPPAGDRHAAVLSHVLAFSLLDKTSKD